YRDLQALPLLWVVIGIVPGVRQIVYAAPHKIAKPPDLSAQRMRRRLPSSWHPHCILIVFSLIFTMGHLILLLLSISILNRSAPRPSSAQWPDGQNARDTPDSIYVHNICFQSNDAGQIVAARVPQPESTAP